jgi:hypothetical protein
LQRTTAAKRQFDARSILSASCGKRHPKRGRAVAAILDHIRSLESYVERSGARLVRSTLPESVHGRVSHDVIMLRVDLDPEQELLTLVHELAHWLAHRGVRAHQPCTVFEYEAEAVEAVVMARLGLPRPSAHDDSPPVVGFGYARDLGEQSNLRRPRGGHGPAGLKGVTHRPPRCNAP